MLAGVGQVKIGNAASYLVKNADIDENVKRTGGMDMRLSNLPSDYAKDLLEKFGDYGKGIELDTKSAYAYSCMGDIVQLSNETTGKNIISVTRGVDAIVEQAKSGFLTRFKEIFKQI